MYICILCRCVTYNMYVLQKVPECSLAEPDGNVWPCETKQCEYILCI